MPVAWVSLGLRCNEIAESHEWQAVPKMNDLHLQWLALYQFHGLSAAKIADVYTGEEHETVKKAIERAAKKTGIVLRPGKRGPAARKL